jgi:hypothetical protein
MMGGGAGITITARCDGFYFTARQKKAVIEIESWDAIGYEDGMRDIRGNMLKATAYFDIDAEDKEYLKKNHFKLNEKLWVSKFTAEEMIFSGYVRGKWEKQFPLTLKGTVEFEGLGDKDITVEVKPKDKEEFGYFWDDVFNYCADPDDKDDDGNEVSLESQYEWHEEDNRMNYGKENAR